MGIGWGENYPLDSVLVRVEPRLIVDVVRRIKDGRYDLNPDFQRAFVWSEEKQSRLIESCIMRIPLPVFYVAEDTDGRIVVVDGLQRLNTFKRFHNNDFKLTFPLSEEGTPHPLQGKTFDDLEIKLRERIEDTPLTLYILDSKTPERAKLDIFDRVNSGVPLTRQQMRNSLYKGEATKWLRERSESELFRRVTGDSIRSIDMRDREAINRFCAFHLIGWDAYRSGEMDALLGEVLKKMNLLSSEERDQLTVQFENALLLNEAAFGEHAFRKSLASAPDASRSVINIALFEVCMVWAAKISHPMPWEYDLIREPLRLLIASDNFNRAITQATNTRVAVRNRFELAREALKELIK